jgi:hypothetical protein
MTDARGRQEVGRQALQALPSDAILLTATPQGPQPEGLHVVAKSAEAPEVGRHGVVREVATHHLRQPLTLLRDRLVHPPPQFRFKGFQLGPHPIPSALPLELEEASTTAAADVREAQKVERLRFSQPAP